MEPNNNPEANQPQVNSSNDTNLTPPTAAEQPESPGPATATPAAEQSQEPSPATIEHPEESIPAATAPSVEKSEKQSTSQSEATSSSQPDDQPANQTSNQLTNQPEKPAKKPLPKNQKIMLIATIIILLIALGIGIWCFLPKPSSAPQNDQSVTPPETPTVSKLTLEGNELSDFDFEFLKLNNNSKNIIYSPLSIKYALAMLSEASADESKAQIDNILGNYKPKAYLNSANRSLANAMFLRTNSASANLLEDSYTETLKTKFNANVIPDSFENPATANQWVNKETLGIINSLFDKDNFNTDLDFVLINALAIDMAWNNQLQCADGSQVPCKWYSIRYPHEKYSDSVKRIGGQQPDFDKLNFDQKTEIPAADIRASVNRYDIIKELGEEHIRNTVQAEYEKYLAEQQASCPECTADTDFNLDEYMKNLASNFGRIDESTDFSFYDSEEERVFAKDLKEYDGSTLQYIGFMPKTKNLNTYIDELDASSATELINNLRNANEISNYKDGVITKVYAHIPFFNFDYQLKDLVSNLKELGIVDVFSQEKANLSGMLDLTNSVDNAYIMEAEHKANIDFSNDGIKAAAVTALGGGMGAGGAFDYLWDVPVEEIDLTFDKPFVFIIRDKASGEVWFTGAVYNPIQ